MNLSQIDFLAAAAAATAVMMCGITGIQTQFRFLALQTALFSGICLLEGFSSHGQHMAQFIILAAVVLIVKAAGIPLFLMWAANKMSIIRDKGNTASPPVTLIMAFGAIAAGYFLIPQFAVYSAGNPVSAGMAVALLFIGMIFMVTRRLAISQVTGFLIIENGIFLYGLTQAKGMPHLVEMAVVFEALIAVLIAGLVILRINRNFEHIDVTQMRGLRH
ncbi:MAG: hypothetical protein LWY06_15830 [Firmicutes bacterium]|nr:hypothetical protein [Bacillota bacterium]